MTVQVMNFSTNEEKITIEAIAIEAILSADDLFQEVETPTVKFEFDRKAKNMAEMKYLWKVLQGQRKCQSANSLGEKLVRLCGVITQISDAFLAEEE